MSGRLVPAVEQQQHRGPWRDDLDILGTLDDGLQQVPRQRLPRQRIPTEKRARNFSDLTS
jgi:hypothetical protein